MPSNRKDLSLGFGLEDKVVVVTGASSGIGRASALLFEAVGAKVFATAREQAGLDSLAKEMNEPAKHFFHVADLETTGACEGIVSKALKVYGEIFVLAHIAGGLRRRKLAEVTEDDWNYQMNVNLRSGFFLNRAVGAAMIERKTQGRIINCTSTAWMTGPMNGSDAYVAAKGGVVTMTRGFAGQFGPHGIRVNVLAPGQVNTPMQHDDNDPKIVANATAACPLRRIGQPEELARAVIFLASDNSSFINGATLNVSGGILMY